MAVLKPFMVGTALLVAAITISLGSWKFMTTGDARWLLCFLVLLIFPRQ